jgi:hypothetical protein
MIAAIGSTNMLALAVAAVWQWQHSQGRTGMRFIMIMYFYESFISILLLTILTPLDSVKYSAVLSNICQHGTTLTNVSPTQASNARLPALLNECSSTCM